MTNTLRLELFGGFRIAEGTLPLPGFTYSKGKALLAYLAVTGQPCGRETLAALLWSELPDSEARTNLRVVLSNLRQFSEPYLLITRETVGLNPQCRPWIDVVAFQQALAPSRGASDLDQLQAAVTLYRGDLLAGFTVPGASLFDEWVAGQRERLRQLAMFALHALATKYVARRTYLAGIGTLNQLLTLDPWREEAHRQLMELYAHSGQRSAALAQYAICRQILADELGIGPADETQALYHAILANQLDARVPDDAPAMTPLPAEPGGASQRPPASAGPPWWDDLRSWRGCNRSGEGSPKRDRDSRCCRGRRGSARRDSPRSSCGGQRARGACPPQHVPMPQRAALPLVRWPPGSAPRSSRRGSSTCPKCGCAMSRDWCRSY
jgi:DNA-binding SARP family transcriptional activator